MTPMPYSQPQDLRLLLDERRLLELADERGLAAWDDPAVQQVLCEAIAAADREIDAYAGAVRPVPLVPVPPLAARLSARVAVYNLHRRRPHLELGEWGKEYERCLRLLERIAEGKVSLTASAAQPVQAETGAGVSVAAEAPQFGPEIWEGY